MNRTDEVKELNQEVESIMIRTCHIEPDKSSVSRFIAENVSFYRISEEVKIDHIETYKLAVSCFKNIVKGLKNCQAYEGCKDGSFEACLHSSEGFEQGTRRLFRELKQALYTIDTAY